MNNAKCIILVILLSLTAFNCQRKSYCERKAKKFERLIKDCPNLIDTTTIVDTVIIRDTFSINIPAKMDTLNFDSLLEAYCNEARLQVQGKQDSNNIHLIRKKIYSKCSLTELLGIGEQTIIKGLDTFVIAYKGSSKGLELSIVSVKRNINRTNTLVTPCTLKWYNNPMYSIGSFLLIILVIMIIVKIITNNLK